MDIKLSGTYYIFIVFWLRSVFSRWQYYVLLLHCTGSWFNVSMKQNPLFFKKGAQSMNDFIYNKLSYSKKLN